MGSNQPKSTEHRSSNWKWIGM